MLVFGLVGWRIPAAPHSLLFCSFPEDLTCPGWKQCQVNKRIYLPSVLCNLIKILQNSVSRMYYPTTHPKSLLAIMVGLAEFCPLPVPAMLTNSNVNAFNPSTAFQFGMN